MVPVATTILRGTNMSIFAIALLAALYIAGLLLLHLALVEARKVPTGAARRFAHDIEWIVPALGGLVLHAFIVWALITH